AGPHGQHALEVRLARERAGSLGLLSQQSARKHLGLVTNGDTGFYDDMRMDDYAVPEMGTIPNDGELADRHVLPDVA
ncbi:MAG TPA: hypothetical protein VIJ66_09390, partial [Solirubrobacteraceae bacterium]